MVPFLLDYLLNLTPLIPLSLKGKGEGFGRGDEAPS